MIHPRHITLDLYHLRPLYTQADVYHLLRWILTCSLELTIASLAEYLLTEAKLLVVKKYIVTPYDKSYHCARLQRLGTGLLLNFKCFPGHLARDRGPLCCLWCESSTHSNIE